MSEFSHHVRVLYKSLSPPCTLSSSPVGICFSFFTRYILGDWEKQSGSFAVLFVQNHGIASDACETIDNSKEVKWDGSVGRFRSYVHMGTSGKLRTQYRVWGPKLGEASSCHFLPRCRRRRRYISSLPSRRLPIHQKAFRKFFDQLYPSWQTKMLLP